jgi:cytochrome c biogenesis protein CcdA
LLPVYLSVLVLGDDAPSRSAAVLRALAGTAALTVGFVAVFAVFGLALTPVASAVHRHLPWFTVTFGVLLVALGSWLLAGRDLPGLPRPGRRPVVTRSVPSMVGFGAAYALASLGCTIGPFLAIVVSSLRAGSTLAGIGLFLAYAAGMGMVVGIAALALALARTSLIGRMRRLAPAVSRIGGLVVLIAGGYVAYYGWYELRLRRGADPVDPVVEAAGMVQGTIATGIDRLGPAGLAAMFAAAVIVAALVIRRSRSAQHTTGSTSDDGH